MPCRCTSGAAAARVDCAPSILPSRSIRPARRSGIAALVQWALPLGTLVLIPKCPACVAAYVLFFTGIGLSLSAATALRWSLIAVSIAVLAHIIVRAALRHQRLTATPSAKSL